MNQGLDLLDYPWVWLTLNDFYKHFSLTLLLREMTYKAFIEYNWLFISLENCGSKPNHTVATPENKLEIVRRYPILGTIHNVRTL